MDNIESVNILAVDDKLANILALETILEAPHLKIAKALSGNEALARLLDDEFACVLLDVKIPDIDGFELARIIRADKRTKYLPIIFVSGHQKGEQDISMGYDLGAVDYLTKPLDAKVVRSKVNVFAELFRKEHALRKAEAELRLAKAELERRVEERTAQLRAQATELERSNHELAQFAFISSHDLREPIRMVSMYAQLLSSRHAQALDEEAKSYLGFVSEGATRMRKLIDDLLAYSRVGSAFEEMTSVDFSKLLKNVLDDLKPAISESNAQVTSGVLPVAHARETQMARVFQNLIANALKFHGPASPKIFVDATEREQEFEFCVRDSGIGIKPEYHERVFHLFQRLHPRSQYPGTGIGLAISKKTIELHGGRIWIESKEGEGAAFRFTLPKPAP